MESAFFEALDANASLYPDRVVFENSCGERITYAQLKRQSDALACWLASNGDVAPDAPIVVYGHKSPLMLVCFYACAKSGHAYAPVDIVYPRDRVASIVGQIDGTIVLDTTDGALDWGAMPSCAPVVGCEEVRRAAATQPAGSAVRALPGLRADDVLYVLFTSGSTGVPKGVLIPVAHVDMFATWLADCFVPEAGEALRAHADDGRGTRIWFNRAPFSFDVSVADMAGGMTVGDTCFALAGDDEASLRGTFEALAKSDVTDWISTPSFVDQCLADDSFCADLLPSLRRMLLAGEVLRPETVRKVQARFPRLRVFNGYGPTEAGFVTICEITRAMLDSGRSLPIGYAKPDIDLVVLNPETLERVPNGQPGELFLVGPTVGHGYWKLPEQTRAGFDSCPAQFRPAPGVRAYRSGDECIVEDDGLAYYHGRLDLQVKLHGFRIELGDIESALCNLDEVHMACVLPVEKDGSISHLAAFVLLADEGLPRGFAMTKQLKAALRTVLPSYMIPRVFKYLDSMPLNPNGKADRKALALLLGE